MESIFDSVVLVLDGHVFVRCILINCELRYSGGVFHIVDTLVDNCRWAFGGPARLTMEVLSKFNVLEERPADLEPGNVFLASRLQ